MDEIMADIKYVQLEAGGFLSDADFQLMNAEERGIYWSVILYMYNNHGKIQNDPERIKSLSNCGETFFESWKKIEKKFTEKNGFLTHKRVKRELAKARKNIRQKSLAGIASGKARRTAVERSLSGCRTKGSEAKETKSKGRKENNSNSSPTSKMPSLHVSNSLRFLHYLENIIIAKKRADKTAFRNLAYWLGQKITDKKLDESIFTTVLEYADESRGADNPAAAFFATLNRELNYKPKKKSQSEESNK